MKKVYCSFLSLLTVMLLVTGCSTDSPRESENSGTASVSREDNTTVSDTSSASTLSEADKEPTENTTAPLTDTKPDEVSVSSPNTETDITVSAPEEERIITISELCGVDKKTVGETANSLIYTLFDETHDGSETKLSDELAVSEILGLILDIKVSNMGEYVDMYVMKYENYLFDSDGDSLCFSFVPDSYFCYNNMYYEIYESKLGRIRSIIEEYTLSDNPDLCWFTDDAHLDTNFYDNGDEARSVTEIVIYCGNSEVRGYIEGAYDIISVDRESDCYIVTYTYGDFYSHDRQRQSRITVENGEMLIEAID